MIKPHSLEQGDTIGIFAPARKISKGEMEPAIGVIENAGFRVKLADGLYATDRQFAGTDQSRARDLQSLIDDPEVRAILCARGGYGTVRIIDRIKWSGLEADPKWIIGYSDITVLHSHINRHLGIETIHGLMPVNFTDDGNEKALASLWDTLKGNPPDQVFGYHPFNRPGTAEGILTGGNLSVLYSLMGSPSDIEPEGKILFLEDLDEYLYHVDRMMMNIRRNGWLQKIHGVIIGGMTDMNDNKVPFGRTAEEIVHEVVDGLRIPIAFGFPAGHMPDNRALVMGRKVRLSVGENSVLAWMKNNEQGTRNKE